MPFTDCPFCDSHVFAGQFAESANFRAIYNIAPILPGHSLIIPKQHHSSLLGLHDDELGEMMVFSRQVVRTLLHTFGVKAFNWTIQEGDEAGQTVPHLHLHLIPREPGDLPEPGDWYPLLQASQTEVIDSGSRQRITPTQMEVIVQRIRQEALKSTQTHF